MKRRRHVLVIIVINPAHLSLLLSTQQSIVQHDLLVLPESEQIRIWMEFSYFYIHGIHILEFVSDSYIDTVKLWICKSTVISSFPTFPRLSRWRESVCDVETSTLFRTLLLTWMSRARWSIDDENLLQGILQFGSQLFNWFLQIPIGKRWILIEEWSNVRGIDCHRKQDHNRDEHLNKWGE